MAGLIERKAKIDIVIKQQVFVDGKPVYVDGKPQREDFPAKCMFFDASQEDIDYFGKTQNNLVFLIAPFTVILKAGCQIVHDGTTYDARK